MQRMTIDYVDIWNCREATRLDIRESQRIFSIGTDHPTGPSYSIKYRNVWRKIIKEIKF